MALPSVIRVDRSTWVPTTQVRVIKEVDGGAVEVKVSWQDKPLRVDPEYARPLLELLRAG